MGLRRVWPSACATSYSYVLRSYITALAVACRRLELDQLAFLLLLVGMILHRQIHAATGFFSNFFFVSKMQLLR